MTSQDLNQGGALYPSGLENSTSAAAFYEQAVQACHAQQWDAACEIIQRCIAITKSPILRHDAQNLHAAALMMMAQTEDALRVWLEMLHHAPHDVRTLNNIGLALVKLERFHEAIEYLQQAVVIAPAHVEALHSLGIAYADGGEIQQAIIHYQRALHINPAFTLVHYSLATTFEYEGRFDEAHAAYLRLLAIDPYFSDAIDRLIFLQHFRYPLDLSRQQDLLHRFAQYCEQAMQNKQPATDWLGALHTHTPLRVGFVSGDLRRHPVGFFLEGVLTALRDDAQLSNRLVLTAYYNNDKLDAQSVRFQSLFDDWRRVDVWDDVRLAEEIRRDHIDILIDLSGHTKRNRLPMFVLKPAPVQVSWLGYFASTGLSAIDYVLADPISVPESEARWFVEKVWRLPHLRYCFTPPEDAPEVSLPPCIVQSHPYPQMVFGCYQSLSKVNDAVLQCWARILVASPYVRLRIQIRELKRPEARIRFKTRLQQAGIALARVDLFEDMKRPEYLASYAEVDVLLDTFPYPGGTTTAEALWMGVPTITLALPNMLGRQGEALMRNAGLPEWVAYSEEDYVQKAVAWAHADMEQRQTLAELRLGLRARAAQSPVFNNQVFAAEFVDALYGMWQEKCGVEQQVE